MQEDRTFIPVAGCRRHFRSPEASLPSMVARVIKRGSPMPNVIFGAEAICPSDRRDWIPHQSELGQLNSYRL